jgi:hypothetical protein
MTATSRLSVATMEVDMATHLAMNEILHRHTKIHTREPIRLLLMIHEVVVRETKLRATLSRDEEFR